jgi:DNA-binding transcriptional ArsR family regulator
MNLDTALIAFSAISQETRLRVLKLLIEYGRDGAPAGALSDQLEIPHNSLSFHLAQLSHAGLVTSKKQGRSIIYAANNDTIQAMIGYLNENCCIREENCNTDCKLPNKSKTKRTKS